ncbi:hypothetical protein QQ020_26565 [Fulvivirgaceae bacterium BMA12]|uniref:Acetyltransferase n=1 Tax=Agaribacillus aureus TaxID=3051825 RepID=A0ABT8LD18_9BACT|nr:hypothetical protein [Fulvivirgaceae bacterium BMA12]
MKSKSEIGNRNLIKRSPTPITYGISLLYLGAMTKITASHVIDCTRSIRIGNYSIIAGLSSQLWTHGYFHEANGPGRFRVDGEIIIGNNVYVGSKCVFNLGVKVADSITIGSNSSVSKSLLHKGMYVSQPLRYLESDANTAREKLIKVEVENLIEQVYEKKIDL